MEFGEIFKDALKYPISDYKALLIVGVLFLISSLVLVLAQFGVSDSTFSMVWAIVALLVSILLMGYALSVMKNGIELDDEIPAFDWVKNFVDGLKVLVVNIIYMIIPTIICGIIGFISIMPAISEIFSSERIARMGSSADISIIFSTVPSSVWDSLFAGIAITAIIAIILFIIFGLFETIAQCRLAKYDSLGEAFSVGEIYSDIKEIGILKLIAFLIVLWIIACIIGIIGAFITAIPYVGLIIAALVVYPFILLYSNRALGLLYSDV
ncbi:DUF4013 domain-containing protein [Methanobrevibacter sp.]|uniref:DUF4013 domain-containing protein n=1 Tax=Methanobrevibacter sp. TaxID=66852 RepID=UPI00388FF066